MTPEERAREALLRCIDKPRYLEAYQPEIARAIREAIEAEREACAQVADQYVQECEAEARKENKHSPQWLDFKDRAVGYAHLAHSIRARS